MNTGHYIQIFIGLLTVLIVYLANVKSAARFEGIVSTRLDGTDKDIVEIKKDQKDQWKAINEQNADINEVKGKVSAFGLKPFATSHRVGGD